MVCEQMAAAEPWWEPGTAQGYHMVTFGFILGEVVRRVTGRTLGQYLRTEIAEPLGIDVHIGLPAAEHGRCAEMVNKPHIRDVLAAGGAPERPTTLTSIRWPALAVAMGFVPDDELAPTTSTCGGRAEFPGTNGHVSALGMATFYNALAQEKLLSREHMDLVRVSQGGFDTDLCSAHASPTTAGDWATCSISAASTARTPRSSATAARAARSPSSTWSTGSATRT